MALKRIQGNGVPRMPPLATNELDPNAIQLLTDWINVDLPQRQSFAEWQVEHFGSGGNPNADPDTDPDGDGRTNYYEFLAGTDPNSAGSFPPYPALATSNGQTQLNFIQPANRSAVIEISTDLAGWITWDAPGNQPTFPSMDQMRSISVSLDIPREFFRIRYGQP
jgi:hypothetical protein